MDLRKLVGILAVVACSRSADDAGIVLNVDVDVPSDRALIDQLDVTVDGRRQQWKLSHPLPGSLGVTTSPGSKSVTVQGFMSGTLRGKWSDTIVATQGQVVVRDVHLSYVGTPMDAGAKDAPGDGTPLDGRDAAADVARDAVDADALGKDAPPSDGGTDADALRTLDATDASVGEAGQNPAKDASDARGDASDVSRLDGASVGLDGPAGPDAPMAALNGTYSVSSAFDLQAVAAAPGSVRDTLGLVHGLVTDPGAAILNFADQAGVPALGTLRSVLPDALESRLSGWITSYIKTPVAGVSPYDELSGLDSLVQSLILSWGLESRLALPPGQPGTHAPLSLVFTPSVSFPLEATAGVTSGIDVTATLTWPSGGSPFVSVSDHFMGFPFGRYALQALNTILLAQYGKPNVAAYLSDYVGCSGMADSVSSQCVSVLCVGHKDDLLSVCEGGLSAAASQIEDQIRSLDFKAIRFQSGKAIAEGVAVSRPQDATSWKNGTWDPTVDLGSGPQGAKATFTAVAQVASP
jgi:hypothetical protein